MIDISKLKAYIEDVDEVCKAVAEHSIEEKGFKRWFDNQILNWLNCSFTTSDGRRILQTNDKRYNYEITTTIAMIEEYGEDNKDFYYTELLKRHNLNLEFESINGLQYNPYTTKNTTKKSTSSKKKTKQTSIELEYKPSKETVAERKLKAHIAKINSLKINIKPANNANNTL